CVGTPGGAGVVGSGHVTGPFLYPCIRSASSAAPCRTITGHIVPREDERDIGIGTSSFSACLQFSQVSSHGGVCAVEVLLVEDDVRIARLVERALREAGHHVDVATDGVTGLSQAQSDDRDLIILDILLPGIDGLSVCRRLRERGNRTPVLMLTARD